MKTNFKKVTKGHLLVVLLAAILFVLLLVLAASLLIRNGADGRLYSDADAVPKRTAGLVLGCSWKLADGRENLFFKTRMDAAARLFKAGKVEVLIVSGDNHHEAYDEATNMKNALVAAGVPAEKIFCDYAGFRTLDSVVRARRIFGQDKVTVVSQKFHNQRAIFIARHHGIDAIGFNAVEVEGADGLRTIFREQFARVKTVFDVYWGVTPRFLGEPVDVSAPSGR